MIKSAKAGQLAELSEAIELIGGQSSPGRRFILLYQFGKGGFSEVFKSIDLSTGQYVALKRLNLTSYRQADLWSEMATKHLLTLLADVADALVALHSKGIRNSQAGH